MFKSEPNGSVIIGILDLDPWFMITDPRYLRIHNTGKNENTFKTSSINSKLRTGIEVKNER